MPSPFPGMDPYLEHPGVWPDVHAGLIVAIRDALAPRLRPRYRVAIEKRTYLAESEDLVFVGRPDVAVVREGPATTSREPAVSVVPTMRPVTVTIPEAEEGISWVEGSDDRLVGVMLITAEQR